MSPLVSTPSSPDVPDVASEGVVRAYLAIAVGMLLTASAVKQHIDPGFVNPAPVWVGLAGFGASLLALSLRHRLTNALGRRLVYAFSAVSILWVASLLVLNRFDPDAAVGYFMVVVGTGATFSMLFDRLSATASFMGFAVVTAIGAGLLTPDPVYSPVLFTANVAATAAVMLISTRVQKQLTASLHETRRLYAGAEAAGGIGSWVLDVASGESRWSDGMCALIGVAPLGDRPAPSMAEYMDAGDLPASQAAFESVLQGDLHEHSLTMRMVTADGRARTLGGVIRGERGADGAVVRVVGVATDVTAQSARQAELVEALDRAEAAARLKEAILANMSHEIRTPLTAVIGFAELLAEESDVETRPLVEPILTGGQRLLDTLNSVLDLARLESDGGALEVWPVDLCDAARGARGVYAETAALNGLTLRVEGDGAPVPALADAPALGRVLDNLVSNALRFTDIGGVTLRVYTLPGRAVLEVADTGRGMATAFRPRAFEAFVQESEGDARSHEGSGLGLTIVQRLVEAMDGEVALESVVGQGTCVRVSLPAAQAAALAAPRDEPVWVARRRLASLPAVPTLSAASAVR